MLLTADVGNTNIKIGIFDENKLKFKFRFSTDKSKTSDEFAVELYSFFLIYGLNAKKVDASIISSVVPAVTYPLRVAIQTVTGAKKV